MEPLLRELHKWPPLLPSWRKTHASDRTRWIGSTCLCVPVSVPVSVAVSVAVSVCASHLPHFPPLSPPTYTRRYSECAATTADNAPFPNLSIRSVPSIIAVGLPRHVETISSHTTYDQDSFGGLAGTGTHLSPDEFHQALQRLQPTGTGPLCALCALCALSVSAQ